MSVTTPEEYYSKMNAEQDPNAFSTYIRLPANEPIYEINLADRTVAAPEFLSVENDHDAEILWFKTNRFYENFDLLRATVWIEYKTANNKFYYSSKPIVYLAEFGENTILIPWPISRDVAQSAGTVEFAFEFFELSEDKSKYYFILNTRPAKSKILAGMYVDPLKDHPESEENDPIVDTLHRIEADLNRLKGDYELYWIDP